MVFTEVVKINDFIKDLAVLRGLFLFAGFGLNLFLYR